MSPFFIAEIERRNITTNSHSGLRVQSGCFHGLVALPEQEMLSGRPLVDVFPGTCDDAPNARCALQQHPLKAPPDEREDLVLLGISLAYRSSK